MREAYQTLKTAGIIETANGRAPRVAKITDSGIVQLLGHTVRTEQVMVHHILELGAAIEINAAEGAARNRKAEHASALTEHVDRMKASLEYPSRFVTHDIAFHGTIAQASGNPLLEIMVRAMRKSLAASMQTVFRNGKQHTDHDQIIRTHRRIAEAISDRDADQAKRWMKHHFDQAFLSLPDGAPVQRAKAAGERSGVWPQKPTFFTWESCSRYTYTTT